MDDEDLVEVTGHMSRQMAVPWNSKGFCHSEAVFSLNFNTMSRRMKSNASSSSSSGNSSCKASGFSFYYDPWSLNARLALAA